MQIGWIDFSKEQRNKVLSVLRILSEPGALDELGIGIIRDQFADRLFPGTSTIQTRAKYFFLVPYIMLELEKHKNIKPHEFLSLLDAKEIELIDILAKGDTDGVIGIDAGKELKRKPSSIYWNGLKTYGFFIEEGLSIAEYAAAFCSLRDRNLQTRHAGNIKYDDQEAADDWDSVSRNISYWRVPLPPTAWRKSLSISLIPEEALFLKQKIVTMPRTKDTLLAWILNENRSDFCSYEVFSDIDNLVSVLPGAIKADYIMARDFAQFIYGAHIRYNHIYTEGRNEKVNVEWEAWKQNIPDVDLEKLFLNLAVTNNHLKEFLKVYQMKLNSVDELDKLIIARERQLKGPSRSKLTNKSLYKYKGTLINMERLSYRLRNARRIVKDIFAGEGKADAEA